MNIKEKRFPSSDGKHQLYCKIYEPEGEPCGLFHVVHGMVEHIERFDGIMRAMCENGWVSYGFDNLGHGKTVNDDSELGYIGGYKYLLADVRRFTAEMKKEYPGLPAVLMGHSMGSFIVRNTVTDKLWDKLIIMGTGGPNPAAAPGMLLLRAEILRNGERGYSDFIEKMMFGQYNKGFQEDDMLAWLSTLQETRDLYRDDPKCGFRFTLSADRDLVTLLRLCNRKSWFTRANMNMPILLVSGSEDPVGDHGKGVEKVYKGLKAAGKDVRMKLYQGYRHEILNDACRDEVIADISAFAQEGL